MQLPRDTDHHDLHAGLAPWSTIGRPKRIELPRDHRCDVLIVGAGITGAMVAEHLTAQGHGVTVVDREKAGLGSTAASTAMLQWEIDRSLGELAELYGFERAADIYRHSLQAVNGLQNLIRTLDLSCAFHTRASLYLADGTGTGAAELKIEHELRERAGLPGFYLDHRRLLGEFGIAREAAILSPGSAEADPLCLSHQLLAVAAGRGANLYDSEAVAFEAAKEGVAVTMTEGQTIEARHVVLATGYVMPKLVNSELHRASSSWAIATPAQKPEALWRGNALIWEASTPYCYARTTHDHRIIIGGEDDPDLADPDARNAALPAKVEAILGKLRALFPETEARADYAWSGAFSETRDGLPLIGRVQGHPNLYAAYGYGGNGITFSFLAAQMIGRMIVGKDEPWFRNFAIDRSKP
jgi:glycine/D-amino acid oxidase-like deaminating enzyme